MAFSHQPVVNNIVANSFAFRQFLTSFFFLTSILTYPHVLQQSENFLVQPILKSQNHENATIFEKLFPLPQQVPAYLPSPIIRRYLYNSGPGGTIINSTSIISFFNTWTNRSEKHRQLPLIEPHCTKNYITARSIIKLNYMSAKKFQPTNSLNSSEMQLTDADPTNKKRTISDGNSQQHTKTQIVSTAPRQMEVAESQQIAETSSADHQTEPMTPSTDPTTTFTAIRWQQITQLLEPFHLHEPGFPTLAAVLQLIPIQLPEELMTEIQTRRERTHMPRTMSRIQFDTWSSTKSPEALMTTHQLDTVLYLLDIFATETTGINNAKTRLRNRHAALLAEAATRGLVLDELNF